MDEPTATQMLNKTLSLAEIRDRIVKYNLATKELIEHRVKLRQIFMPKMLISKGKIEYQWPEEFLKMDKPLQEVQEFMWETIVQKGTEK